MADKFISAGVSYNFIGRLDSTGFMTGISGSAPSAGATGEAMTRMLGINTANVAPVEPEDTNIPGDDVSQGIINFPPGEQPTWIAELSVNSLSLNARLQSTTVFSEAGISMNIIQPNDPDFVDTFIIYQSRSKKKDTATSGQKNWSGVLVPVAQSVPLGRGEFNYRAAASYRYKVTAQPATKLPTGVTINDSVHGTTGGSLIEFESDYPIVYQVFQGTGALATFTLADYRPVSAAKCVVYVNTQQLTPSSVSTTAPYSFTLGSNPASGTKVVIGYEFQP